MNADAELAPVTLQPLTESPEAEHVPSVPSALEDVPLTVEVELGYIDVPLEDVKHYGKGTQIPLAAAAGDPVTLVLNGQPIALGDLVVVGDHYAVRLTRLLTGNDRGVV